MGASKELAGGGVHLDEALVPIEDDKSEGRLVEWLDEMGVEVEEYSGVMNDGSASIAIPDHGPLVHGTELALKGSRRRLSRQLSPRRWRRGASRHRVAITVVLPVAGLGCLGLAGITLLGLLSIGVLLLPADFGG